MLIIRNKKVELARCWSCNRTVYKSEIIRRTCDTMFPWKCYGEVDICKECNYFIDHDFKCPKCGMKMTRRLRYKNWMGEYKEFKTFRFRCFECKTNYRLKKK